MSINKTRGFLYWMARILGDINAVSKGPGAIGRRIVRKSAWKGFAKAMRWL